MRAEGHDETRSLLDLLRSRYRDLTGSELSSGRPSSTKLEHPLHPRGSRFIQLARKEALGQLSANELAELERLTVARRREFLSGGEEQTYAKNLNALRQLKQALNIYLREIES